MVINRVFLVHSVEVMTSGMFKKKLSVIALEVRHVLESVMKVDVPAGMSIYKTIKKKADTASSPLEKSMSADSAGQMLKAISTEQV